MRARIITNIDLGIIQPNTARPWSPSLGQLKPQLIKKSLAEKTAKLGKQEVSDMVVEASSTFSRNGSVRTSKRSVRSHSRQSSLAGDGISDGHISTSG